MGLVTAVVEDAEALAAVVAERSTRLAGLSRTAVYATKALLVDDTATTVAARLDLDRRVLQSLLPAL
jgi:enoyl-CoA hydratase/carnithine racemase